MKKLLLMVSFFICLTMNSFALPGIDIEGAVGVWGSAPSGDFGYKSAQMYNLEDTFGFEDEAFPMARLKLEIALIPNIYLMATPMKFEGKAENHFDFDNYSFTADADTELNFNQYDLALYYGVPFQGLASLGKFHVDAGLNLRIVELDAEMTHDATGLSRSESVTVPIPMIYLAADLRPVDLLTIEAEIRALPVSDYEVISAIGRLKFNIPGPFYLAGGYRHDSANVDHDDFEFDIQFCGPFAEAGFSF